MIRLDCSNCQTVLTIDDAFAGGVCRCQHCGTIQTVPKPGDSSSAEESKALFRRKARIESALNPYSDSLDRAADEVDSSGGLSPSALAGITQASRRMASAEGSAAGMPSPRRADGNGKSATASPANGKQPKAPSTPAPTESAGSYEPRPSHAGTVAVQEHSNKPLILSIVAGVVVLIGIAVWIVMSVGDQSGNAAAAVSDHATTSSPSIIAPGGQRTVYMINRADCSEDSFARMMDLVRRSAQALTPQRQFQMVLWNAAVPTAFPVDSMADANDASIEESCQLIGLAHAGEQAIETVIPDVLSLSPSDLVLVSAVDLDERTAASLVQNLASQSIKVHGVIVGNDDSAERMQQVTAALAGEFQRLGDSVVNAQ